ALGELGTDSDGALPSRRARADEACREALVGERAFALELRQRGGDDRFIVAAAQELALELDAAVLAAGEQPQGALAARGLVERGEVVVEGLGASVAFAGRIVARRRGAWRLDGALAPIR